MFPDSPIIWRTVQVSADKQATLAEQMGYGRFVAITAGVRLKLADISNAHVAYSLASVGARGKLENESTGPVLLEGAFIGDRTGILVPPGRTVFWECYEKSGEAGYEYAFEFDDGGILDEAAWTYQPTITTDGDGFDETKLACAAITHGGALLWIWGYCTTTDGDGETITGISLPAGIIPPYVANLNVPILCEQTIDGTPTEALGYIALTDTTAANRCIIQFRGASAFTNAKTSTMQWSGFIPLDIDKWTSISVTETWTTGTPASITEAIYRFVAKDICFQVGQWTSTDSNGATALSWPLFPSAPDIDSYMPAIAIQTHVDGVDATTYLNPLPLIDLANATEANRKATCQNFTTAIDAKEVTVCFAQVYPAAKNQSGWTSYDCDPTYTGTAPATNVVEKGYWSADGGVCAFLNYLSADDGNGATAVVTDLPMKPSGLMADFLIPAYQYQHTDTKRNPLARVDYSSENIQMDLMHALDDTEATKLYIGGVYPVC